MWYLPVRMPENIALVVLDTLRYDAFEKHFDWLPGVRFTNAYSTSHWTVPAHGSLFTGRYPSEIGVHSKSASLDCPDETLAESLRAAGYETRLWSANPNTMFWEGWDRGFSQVLEPGSLDPRHVNAVDWTAFLGDIDTHSWTKYPRSVLHAVRADCSTVAAMKQGYRRMTTSDADGGGEDVLARARDTDFGSPEFTYVNLMEAHAPYHTPESVDADSLNVVVGDAFADSVDSPERLRASYDASAAYLSEIYEEIFAELRKEFDYVVTVSDHGEMLGEHGMWNHGYGLYPELTHVPVVVSGDGVESRRDDATVSLLDVHRTILDLAGVDAPADARGQSLLDDPASRTYLTEYHGFLDRHREQFERKGVVEAFERYDGRLHGIATPPDFYGYQTDETADRAEGEFRSTGESRLDDPRAELEARVDELDVRTVDAGQAEVTEDVEERLETLGYA